MYSNRRVKEWKTIRAAECFAANVCEANCKQNKTDVTRNELVKWRPPNHGWIKVNSDGATSKNGDWSAIGGVLMDSSGSRIKSFRKFVSRGSPFNAELWGIL